MNSDHPFVFKKAEDDSDLARIYQLRYRVYVEEWGFEDPTDHPNGVETDEYDRCSVHFMALRDGETIGTIRLVLRTEQGFPLERHCPPQYTSLEPFKERVAEISRLAVSKCCRRRKEDQLSEAGSSQVREEDPRPHERRRNPEIVLGLFQMMYVESKQRGLTHWCAAMEQSLVQRLARTQIVFDQVGPEIDYHGRRAPYLVEIAYLEKLWARNNPEIFRKFVSGLPKPLDPAVEALLAPAAV